MAEALKVARETLRRIENRYAPPSFRKVRHAFMHALWQLGVELEARLLPRRAMLWRGPGLVDQIRPDVLEDLTEFTSLPPDTLRAFLLRQIANYRTEWYDDPAGARHWYFLSSRYYLFANATQFGNWTFQLPPHLASEKIKVLDFGGGIGTASFDLAKEGHEVDFLEINALQKEFVRFRSHKHKIPIGVLDAWCSLTPGTYDIILAHGVFVVIPDFESLIVQRLAPALRVGGYLLEDSPFGTGIETPDVLPTGLDAALLGAMRTAGLEQQTGRASGCRIWQKVTAAEIL